MSKKISVKSHVSRDFLQNAVYFNTLPKVVWEYVSNSLDNGKDDIPTTVAVEIRKDDGTLIVADNGAGMSREDLERFFTMHGENIQRKRGKRVRGRFGTGKSAAFGIAKSLLIDARRDGKKNVVSLHLEDIKKATSGETFEVNEIIVDEKTDQDDGTIIEIKEFMTARMDIDATISYIEKHLSRYRMRANVIINGHTCKFKELPCVETVTVQVPTEIEQHIGSPTLTIKVAPFTLDQDERGIDILSESIWHETTLGDVEGKELSERLFGEVDVPLLEQVSDDIAPFDNTRNNLLNRANPRVVILIAWISQELEKVRQSLVKEEREKRKTEQAKKLAQEAQRMADILNEDFKNFMIDLEVSRRITGKTKSKINEAVSLQGEVLPGDGDQDSRWQQSGQPHGNGHRGKNPPGEGDLPREGPNLIPGNSKGTQKDSSESGSKRRSGLFSIEFVNSTKDYPRSQYKREEHKILINLDHPQIALALKEGGGTQDSRHFLAMVYEVATVEYAQAVQFERFNQGEQIDAAEALFAVGDTVDRVTRRFSEVLQA
ncbi:MAG: ATP-binding protein [Chloroflexi bacterium]|nr:ATP-binding protein [Chloroflexota bacterium]